MPLTNQAAAGDSHIDKRKWPLSVFCVALKGVFRVLHGRDMITSSNVSHHNGTHTGANSDMLCVCCVRASNLPLLQITTFSLYSVLIVVAAYK